MKKDGFDDFAGVAVVEKKNKDIEVKEFDLYDMNPNTVAPDIIINTEECTKLIHQSGSSDVRLYKGDRVQGDFFAALVREQKIQGLALCCKLSASFLKTLNEERDKRHGLIPDDYVVEAHKRKEK